MSIDIAVPSVLISGMMPFLKPWWMAGAIGLLLAACHRPPAVCSSPLPQRGYLWQRDWTLAVQRGEAKAEEQMDGVVLLGAELRWRGSVPQPIRANIPWASLTASRKPLAVALRVAPYPGPFSADDTAARAISELAKALCNEAKAHGVVLSEFQLDFDCAQKKLADYCTWVRMLKPIVHPLPLVITTLPAWLDESHFADLIREADGYVLQVHSVPTQNESGRSVLCDPALARKWVAKAASLQIPFSVALPTYRCLAGYGPGGKLLGVAMDSIQPAWPAGTTILEFGTNPDDIADLIREWSAAHPPSLKELLWYRIPVGTDINNWRWPTLSAVMAGHHPAHRLEIKHTPENPSDIQLVNTGEAEEKLTQKVVVHWQEGTLVSGDALGGWSLISGTHQAVFTPMPGPALRLSPGESRAIGWLRYDKQTPFECRLER